MCIYMYIMKIMFHSMYWSKISSGVPWTFAEQFAMRAARAAGLCLAPGPHGRDLRALRIASVGTPKGRSIHPKRPINGP